MNAACFLNIYMTFYVEHPQEHICKPSKQQQGLDPVMYPSHSCSTKSQSTLPVANPSDALAGSAYILCFMPNSSFKEPNSSYCLIHALYKLPPCITQLSTKFPHPQLHSQKLHNLSLQTLRLRKR